MVTTLPTLTRRIDDAFTTTWYEIRPEAIDNILNNLVVWAALQERGVLKTQVGGEFITRTIRHGSKDASWINKASTLTQGEDEIETMARWDWRYVSSHVVRSIIDDQKNNGPSKIKSLVAVKTGAARDALEQEFEAQILGTENPTETGDTMMNLNDIVPSVANRTTGTYGGIAQPTAFASGVPSTGNVWWGGRYKELTAPKEVNLVTDMVNLYNTLSYGSRPPNLIITDQTLFELYENMALDPAQIVKRTGGVADLGFEVLMFKGKDMIFTGNMSASNALFLNTDFIDVVYDPQLWFDMTEWKPVPLETRRIAHFLSAVTTVSSQRRCQGRLHPAA
jgi:hypothetical protein